MSVPAAPTEILLTVDIEFHIAGAVTYPDRYAPLCDAPVHGMVDGRSHGLGFVLDTLARHGLPATFFVEALNTRYFGDAPMAAVCRRIAAAGHDIQLHLHPVWTIYDDGARNGRAVDDACAGRGREAMLDLLRQGQASFARWDLPAPVALRTGGLSADRAVYAAMSAAGMDLASNICAAINPPTDPGLHLLCGRHRIGGVLEVPVTSFCDWRAAGRRHLRPLQVSACSAREMRAVLRAARRAGVETVVVLTHTFEYFKRDGFRFRRLRVNRINQARLDALCRFVAAHPHDFVALDFARAAKSWRERPEDPSRPLDGAAHRTVLRMATNALNDRIWPL